MNLSEHHATRQKNWKTTSRTVRSDNHCFKIWIRGGEIIAPFHARKWFFFNWSIIVIFCRGCTSQGAHEDPCRLVWGAVYIYIHTHTCIHTCILVSYPCLRAHAFMHKWKENIMCERNIEHLLTSTHTRIYINVLSVHSLACVMHKWTANTISKETHMYI